jgi:Sel1 repeat-containing protein
MATRTKRGKISTNRVPPLRLAFALALFLACLVFLPGIKANSRVEWSLLGAAGSLLCFLYFLRRQVIQTGRELRYEFLPKPVHYVQLTMHSCIYAYWGWYWREVYHQVPLIFAQLVFVYALDMLVCWSRRDKWILGFGPFPIVLSTNLFLWFKPDWFFLQFLMLATGVLCKEFITWTREGRRAHIFNPSAIALFVFSVGLIVTHSTQISWGEEIAVSFDRPPHIYLEIFLLGLVVQGLFSVTLVTLSAAAALYAMNLVFTHATGLYYFVDTNIPAAVFLGLHLLVTDPATSPRKGFGKIVFGAGYGALVFGLYWLLGWIGAPTFYDKLLCVPLLNLTVRALDRVSVALEERFQTARFLPAWTPRQTNLAHMGVWICLFAVMFTTGFLGSHHPGADPEFWRKACLEGHSAACQSWVRQMKIGCYHGSGPACMVLGNALNDGRMVPADPAEAAKNFAHSCELGVSSGCANVFRLVAGSHGEVFQSACDRGDSESCFLLGSLYYAGQGVPKDPGRAFHLFQQSCTAGWWRGCSGLAECYRAGQGTVADSALALDNFDKACRAGIAPSCFSAASMYHSLDNESLAEAKVREGCEISLGNAESSAAYSERGSPVHPTNVPAICVSAGR